MAVNEAATECCPWVLGSTSGHEIILPSPRGRASDLT
jgi:hypothetical protein